MKTTNEYILACLKDVTSQDRTLQDRAFTGLMTASELPVDWAYEA